MALNKVLKVGDRSIGPDHPCFIIAEIGMNHGANFDVGCAFVEAASQCGVDAVKFQTISATDMYPPDHPRFEVMKNSEWSVAQYVDMAEFAKSKGLMFFSTAFDEPSADVLDEAGARIYKIGSGELNHVRLLGHVARKGKPIILSTGVADLSEIEKAVNVILDAGNDQLALLHCVSMYPTPVEYANVRAVQTLQERFDLPVGLSDHALSAAVAVAGVTLGACMVEKHFSLSRLLPDGDNDISFLPDQMTALVQSIRDVEACLGTGEKVVLPEEEELRRIIRKGIYARCAISSGEVIQPDMLLVRRPGAEVSAAAFDEIVGKTAQRDIEAQAALSLADLG